MPAPQLHATSALAPGAGAVICRRGHVIHSLIEDPRFAVGRCDDCAAKILVACEACGYRIRGAKSPIARDYRRPTFCDGCGHVFPWTGRRQRIMHLQNVVDDAPIDPATRLEVIELLGELMEREVEDTERHWLRILKIAPELWLGSARETLVALVPAAVKSQLGLRA